MSNSTQKAYISCDLFTFSSKLASAAWRLDWRTINNDWMHHSINEKKWNQHQNSNRNKKINGNKNTCLLEYAQKILLLIHGQKIIQLTFNDGMTLVQFLNLVEHFLDIDTVCIIYIALARITQVNSFINSSHLFIQMMLNLIDTIQHSALQRCLVCCHFNHRCNLCFYLSNFWSNEGDIIHVSQLGLFLCCFNLNCCESHLVNFPSFMGINFWRETIPICSSL
jgi:hypothetical protein